MSRADEPPLQGEEAELVFESAGFRILRPGDYVFCAVSGQAIPLSELRYWSAEKQEAYGSAHASWTASWSAGKK